MTKFYDRKKELESLEQIEKNSFKNVNFTLITGRRRIGKTTLLKKFIEGKKNCYLFTTRTSETLLCQQWQNQLEEKANVFKRNIPSFSIKISGLSMNDM